MSLGSNIKNIRQNKDISIKEISKQLKIFEKAYLNIENGVKKPSDGLLRKLASIFNLTSDDIINYNEERSKENKQRLDLKNLKSVNINQKKDINTNSVQINNVKFIPVEKPSLKDVISKKSMLLDSKDLFKYQNNLDLVGSDETSDKKITNRKVSILKMEKQRISSPRLLSYVEPFEINGINKSLFYTEVNTNYKVGDRVFIIGGPYDIDLSNTKDRYKKGRDGYKILFIDKCKIVLDINYTGVLPFKRDKRDDFLNIYSVNTINEFRYYNSQISTKDSSFKHKFSIGNNNILYTLDAFYFNNGITESGFYMFDDSQESWISVNIDLFSDNYKQLLSNNLYSNERIRINNSSISFTFDNKEYNLLEDEIYKWDINNQNWIIDKDFEESIITKSNFRKGRFVGNFNGGLYGSKENKIVWSGEGNWNMGTLLNVKWKGGTMNSSFTLPESINTQFGDDGKPYEKINGVNNNGSGFNFSFKSELENGIIENGNVYDTTFGEDITHSVVEDYITNNNNEFTFNLNGGYYKNCRFIGGSISNATVDNCRSIKSKFNNISSINSDYKNSLIINSIYMSDNSIKILDYDELLLSTDDTTLNKMYKFYISETSFNQLKIKDRFYIKGLKVKDDIKYPLNFFNKRFKISSWSEYIDYYNNTYIQIEEGFYKRGFSVKVFLSTPGDNENLHTAYKDGNVYKNGLVKENNKKLYSLDIVVSIKDISNIELESSSNIPFSEIPRYGLNLNNDSIIPDLTSNPSLNLFLSNKVRDYIDIENAFIVNSDFDSGLVENTDWISGDHIEYNNDNNIKKINENEYDISLKSSIIEVKTTSSTNNLETNDEFYKKGDIVYLNNLEYELNGNITKLPDTYKVYNFYNELNGELILELEEVNSNIISNINDFSGKVIQSGLSNRYSHIHKTKINKSKIFSGIFRRSYITNSLIENNEYDTNDIDFKNLSIIKSLILSDSIFKNSNNILSKATYINSNFAQGDNNTNDIFSNGIIYNSVWNSGEFNNGVFKESSWEGGTFNNGSFYNNRSFNANPNENNQYFNSNIIRSYYKNGVANSTTKNNRYSWKNGEFNGGIFNKSDWEDGVLNGGNFYYSKFYTGIINGGIIGKTNIKTNNTIIYSGTINDTIVENALLKAENPNYNNDYEFIINWYDGLFNSGEINTSLDTPTSGNKNVVIWFNGNFNNGEFKGNSIWKGGSFNGGSFLSIHSIDNLYSDNRLDYSWQNGEFNGGTFGNGQTSNNPTWFNGEFNGGIFKGKIWNNGIFNNGEFRGSGRKISTISNSNEGDKGENASKFVDSFLNNSNNFYGLWKNGIVSNSKDKYYKDKKFFTKLTKSDKRTNIPKTILNGILWLNGEFNNKDAEMLNSVWLNGRFGNGKFISSSFNPFVNRKRDDVNNPKSFNLDDSCVWNNGELSNSDFYISQWHNGVFNIGNAYGVHWINGICLYMNAYNIFWENGTWRNGNWNGSYADYNNGIVDEFDKQIILKGMSLSETNDCHVWNVFDNPKDIAENLGIAESKDTVEEANVIEGDFIPLVSISIQD